MSRFEHELRALGKRRIGLRSCAPPISGRIPKRWTRPTGDGFFSKRCELWSATGSRSFRNRVGTGPGAPHCRAPRGCASARTPGRPRTLRLVAGAGLRRRGASSVRRRDLQAINAFLLAMRDGSLCAVPTRERSLQVFGDEKRLDQLRKGGSSLFEGRVSLDDLKCYPVAPPLPYETPEKPAPGKAILVLENYHSFDSFRRWNRKTALYAAVAYGAGNAFRQGAGNLDDVVERIDADGAVYLGDLDPAGVEILIGVNSRRQEEGRAALRPHRGLYRWLLDHGCRRPLEAGPGKELIQRLGRPSRPTL